MADDTNVEQDNASTPVSGEGQSQDAVPPEVRAALKKANKEAETLRLQLKAFEDRDKTEAERLAERATAAEARVAETEARALRLEVAFEKGLTPAQAKRLVGGSREELEADADEILRDFPVAAAAGPPGPRVDSDQGARPGALPLNGDPLTESLKAKLGIR